MRVDEFDFDLPEENIALRPAEPRGSSRMMVVNQQSGSIDDYRVADLVDFLQPGDALVFNDTRVIPAQLEGTRTRNGATAKISATLHMRLASNAWKAFVRGAKKLKIGDIIQFGEGFTAEVTDKAGGGEVGLLFNRSGAELDLALVEHGHIPLPPYIALKRPDDEQDKTDYQTVYAKQDGAVAAPTAGLHFTDELLDQLDAKGISKHFVTLHVGAGTFLPVKVEDTEDHQMHSEIGIITNEAAAALNAVKAEGGRVISVGTTSLRLLESACDEAGQLIPWSGPTDIFITPGYRFRFIDALMTNFHLPRSTLFMLVSAFAGRKTMRKAYQHAIDQGYRFYSYGDSSLLFPSSD